MPEHFDVNFPLEHAYTRKMLLAAKIIDAVTLEPVTSGLEVTATGLKRRPIINCEGWYVFLEEGDAQPQQVVVEAKALYENIVVAAPALPARRVRIELSPRIDYPFAHGITAMRGTLIESATGNRVTAPGAAIRLQWVDDTAGGTFWVDAPGLSHTNASGDFAATLRLSPNQVPRLDGNGRLTVRLRVRRENATRNSTEFSLAQGCVADALPQFAWNELVP